LGHADPVVEDGARTADLGDAARSAAGDHFRLGSGCKKSGAPGPGGEARGADGVQRALGGGDGGEQLGSDQLTSGTAKISGVRGPPRRPPSHPPGRGSTSRPFTQGMGPSGPAPDPRGEARGTLLTLRKVNMVDQRTVNRAPRASLGAHRAWAAGGGRGALGGGSGAPAFHGKMIVGRRKAIGGRFTLRLVNHLDPSRPCNQGVSRGVASGAFKNC
jgi:hypothetical protein